jgi:predicted nucleotide-binding protein
MARRKGSKQEEKQEPAVLLISHKEAEEKLQDRINIGNDYYNKPVNSEKEYEELKADVSRWNKYNCELLVRVFSNDSIKEEYSRVYASSFLMNQRWPYWLGQERESIADKVNRLKAIQERLELIPSNVQSEAVAVSKKAIDSNNRQVFIVHGHDNEVKETVARVLEKINLEPIILHEQANEGRTIIEKFEDHSDVGFAVILLTPDDQGFAKSAPDKVSDRARQNVILELGYFLGKLGRNRVCALYKAGVEIPSDMSGVLYVPYDGTDAWKFSLAKEIKATGIEIDLNLLM